jgi:regulator of protease activity HflC (stomatin/prohibitin superfamily)
MLFKRIIVGDQERFLITKNGRFAGILSSGEYRMFVPPGVTLATEKFNLRTPVFESTWSDYLVKERPELTERHFVRVETSDVEVALVYLDKKLFMVVPPAKRVLLWKATSDVTYEVIDIAATPEIPAKKFPALERLGRASLALFIVVEEAKAGLFFIDNRYIRTLAPGKYAFWAVTGNPRVELVDMRRQTIEVPGQEILSRDKVSLRVNILAEYQVKDPVKAKQSIKDFEAYFYRLLQLSIRQALGKKTLEEILAEKTELDESSISVVRTEMLALGVEVSAVALKDIILPGDMREIMNQVVSAEKQAQANLIRRREETAATRSLLNTAKLLEDNPILVRLKELETLEKLVEKVDRLTVSGGFEGLLENLIDLTPKPVGKMR